MIEKDDLHSVDERLPVGVGCDLSGRGFPQVGLNCAAPASHAWMGGHAAGDEPPFSMADGLGGGAVEILVPSAAAAWLDDAEAVAGGGVFLEGGSGLDTLGETAREALFQRTGLAAAGGPMSPSPTGPITMDELAILGEASTILWRVQSERTFRRATVEVASLGFATIQMLLENTVDP